MSPPTVLTVLRPYDPREEPVDAATALAMVVDELDGHRELYVPVWSATPGGGRTVVFRLPHRRVLHVVGDGLLAQRFRELITANAVPPWTLAPLAATITDLQLIREHAGTGAYGALERAGFTRVEEVAALPDRCLAELRNMGPVRLAAIREVAPYRETTLAHPAAPDAATTAGARGDALTARLGTARARLHQELVELLARSDLPDPSVELIVASLAGETLPPPDPAVLAVLAAAREPALLRAYQDTHGP